MAAVPAAVLALVAAFWLAGARAGADAGDMVVRINRLKTSCASFPARSSNCSSRTAG
jgi:hypothetical protein